VNILSVRAVLAHMFFLGFAAFGLLTLATSAIADPKFLDRKAILDQSLQNHQLGNHSAARQGLKFLLRSSPDPADEAYVLDLYHGIRNTQPWFISGGFSILPSTNINAASSQDVFKTSIGDLSINDGGKAQSGVSFRGQVEFGRGFVLGQGREASLSLSLSRQTSGYSFLSRSDAFVTASYEQLGRWGSFTATPSVGFVRYDQAKTGEDRQDRYQYSLFFAGERHLSPFRTVFASLGFSRSEYTHAKYNDANSVDLGFGFSGYLGDRIQIIAKTSLGRLVTRNAHTTKSYGSVEVGANMPFLIYGNLGVNASLSGSAYDGIFPLLAHARTDGSLSIGFSYGDSRIKIFGKTPELNCSWKRTNSSVALYTNEVTDCEVSLTLRF
jgi:hypothetical protein